MMAFKIVVGILFGLLILAISVLGILSYQNNQDSTRAFYLVRHTHEVLDQTEEIASLFKDIQLEGDAFFISGDSAVLIPYRQAREVILSRANRLRFLTSDNPGQQMRIDGLNILLKKLMNYSDSVFLVSGKEAYSQKNLLSRVESNKVFRTKIRNVIDDIKNEEKRLLVVREKATEQSITTFNRGFFELLTGIFILLATTFFTIRYNFNKRIRAQQDLKMANDLFVKLFHESPIGLVISQLSDGIIIDCNKAYAELVNYSREEIIGKTSVRLKILMDESQRNEIIKAVKESGVVRDIEVRLKPKKKDPIWVSISVQSIQVQKKHCLLCAILDITVHKLAEERTKDALATEKELNKMKSNFVTLASHEFRTPLTTILSSAFLLEKYSVGEQPEKAIKHIARIKSSVNNLTSILDEFLSLTKIEERKVEPRLEMFNLKEYLNTICLSLKSFAKPGQNIVYHHHGNDLAYTDPVLLGNIINNLVSNAIKYSPPGTNIYVSSNTNSGINLAVKDSGIGIPAQDQKHLFERFYRASNAGAVQGTGLGLHIMKHYVDLLNGSIQVNSELGKGTEFKIVLTPLSPEAEIVVDQSSLKYSPDSYRQRDQYDDKKNC